MEILGNLQQFYVLMKYNCLQESPNTDLFVSTVLMTLIAIKPVIRVLCYSVKRFSAREELSSPALTIPVACCGWGKEQKWGRDCAGFWPLAKDSLSCSVFRRHRMDYYLDLMKFSISI